MKKTTAFLTLFLLSACDNSSPIEQEEDDKLGSLPSFIIEPPENTTTPEKVALGRLLF